MSEKQTINYPAFRLIRFAFVVYLVCVGLANLVKLVCFSMPFADLNWFAGLLVHPATGMLLVFPEERRARPAGQLLSVDLETEIQSRS